MNYCYYGHNSETSSSHYIALKELFFDQKNNMFTLWTAMPSNKIHHYCINEKEDARVRGMENQFIYFSNPTFVC